MIRRAVDLDGRDHRTGETVGQLDVDGVGRYAIGAEDAARPDGLPGRNLGPLAIDSSLNLEGGNSLPQSDVLLDANVVKDRWGDLISY